MKETKEVNYFTAKEVAKHNTKESCWLIVNDWVVDVTPFLNLHPAGVESIMRHAGQDATEDFYFHPQEARSMWKKYRVGKLKKELDDDR